MKNIFRLFLAGFLACPFACVAQQTPLFQFTLYFEDSIGNRDSIVMGYDPDASSQNLNPQFGEIEITTPFDSIFEVRAIHGDDSSDRTSKKIIESIDLSPWDSCVLFANSKIAINVKFPPVRITYDSTLFPLQSCRNIVLSPEWNLFVLQEWWDACDYHCMAGASSYVATFITPPLPGGCWNRLYIEKEVEGHGLKMLPGLFFASFSGAGPCNDTTFLSAPITKDAGFGVLSPQPAGAFCSVQVPEGGRIQAVLWDISGRQVNCPYSLSNGTARFDTEHLLPGLYFLHLQTAGDHRSAVYRLVKM